MEVTRRDEWAWFTHGVPKGKCLGVTLYPEPVQVFSDETLKTVTQMKFDANGQMVRSRIVELEVKGRLRRKYNYDD